MRDLTCLYLVIGGAVVFLITVLVLRSRAIQENVKLHHTVIDLLDIISGQVIYHDGAYHHNFMSDGEHLWRILGLTDPSIPAKEFEGAIQRYKKSLGIKEPSDADVR